MTNQQIIQNHLESVHSLAAASGHSMLVYLVEMAILENAPPKELKLEIDRPKQGKTDLGIMFDS